MSDNLKIAAEMWEKATRAIGGAESNIEFYPEITS